MPIDTLKTAKRLQKLGFDVEQAEGLTEILNESDAELATKNDLDQLETRLGSRIDSLGVRIDEVETKLGSRIDSLAGRIDGLEQTMNTRFEAMRADLERLITLRMAWAAGLLALYITLISYLMG